MIDAVKVRARKTEKHGKTYEYRFEVAPIGGERKWYSKGGFLPEKEVQKAELEELKRYYACGLPERSSNISCADFLDEWMENDYIYNLKETALCGAFFGRCTTPVVVFLKVRHILKKGMTCFPREMNEF